MLNGREVLRMRTEPRLEDVARLLGELENVRAALAEWRNRAARAEEDVELIEFGRRRAEEFLRPE